MIVLLVKSRGGMSRHYFAKNPDPTPTHWGLRLQFPMVWYYASSEGVCFHNHKSTRTSWKRTIGLQVINWLKALQSADGVLSNDDMRAGAEGAVPSGVMLELQERHSK